MGQVTIYLDDELVNEVRQAAKTESLSQSRWISNLIRNRFSDAWPTEIESLVGAWDDFAEAEELRAGLREDSKRETL